LNLRLDAPIGNRFDRVWPSLFLSAKADNELPRTLSLDRVVLRHRSGNRDGGVER